MVVAEQAVVVSLEILEVVSYGSDGSSTSAGLSGSFGRFEVVVPWAAPALVVSPGTLEVIAVAKGQS